MMWWFLIFASGAGAVLWAGLSLYIRVRRNIKQAAEKDALQGESEPF
jgi:hypothetical protein